MRSMPERPRTSLWSPLPTSSHASPGLYYPAEASTGHSCASIAARKRRLRLGSAIASHVTAPRRRLELSHRSLHRSSNDEKTVTTACLKSGPENGLQRSTDFEGQTRAQLILARRTILHPKAEYICADLSPRPNFPLQSCGGPYISGSSRNTDSTSIELGKCR